MRLALLPIIGFSNIQGESDYVLYKQMVRDLAKLAPPTFSYMCLPRFAFGQGSSEPGLLNLYTEGPTDPHDRGGFHDVLASASLTFLDLFGPRNCAYPIDAVVTSRTDVVPMLARWLWDWRAGEEVIPVVIFEPQICNVDITPRNETWLLNRTIGYLLGHPIFNTEHEKGMALEAASRFLQASLVRRLEQKARVVSVPVDFAGMDAAMAKHRRSDRFTLLFGGRLNAKKRADKMLQLYDEFYQYGRDVDIVVCSPKGEARIVVPPQVKLYTDLKRDDFLAKAAQAHVYLNTSAKEGFSAGFVEQVYMVPVSIVPDLPWTRSLLDEAFAQHPFVYRDFDEARVMLRWAYQHYEDAAKKCEPVRAYLRKRYDNAVVAAQLLEIVTEVVQESGQKFKVSDNQADLLWRAFKDMPERFSFADFWAKYQSKTIAGSKVPQLGELWRWQAYKWLQMGASELCRGPDPEYQKDSGVTTSYTGAGR